MIEIDPTEEVIRVVRKHWFVLVSQGFFYLLMLIIPFVVLVVLFELPLFTTVSLSGPTLTLSVFVAFVWLYLLWNAMFLTLTDYLLDVLVITDRRIFEIEQHGLFGRESSTFRIDRIQDVTVEVKGIVATFLNFGDIHIHTAGEGHDFTGKMMKDPYGVKKQINEAIDHWTRESRNVTIAEPGQTPPETTPATPLTTHSSQTPST
jgi:uncharacterized membrane protein YdbT with pleckstrin-like domain